MLSHCHNVHNIVSVFFFLNFTLDLNLSVILFKRYVLVLLGFHIKPLEIECDVADVLCPVQSC